MLAFLCSISHDEYVHRMPMVMYHRRRPIGYQKNINNKEIIVGKRDANNNVDLAKPKHVKIVF